VGHTCSWVVAGPGTFLTTVVLLWSWQLVALGGGAGFANRHQWVAYTVAALMHGVALTTAYAVASLSVRWWHSTQKVGGWLLWALGLGYAVALLAWPLSDGP
jgi:hypothetical protein